MLPCLQETVFTLASIATIGLIHAALVTAAVSIALLVTLVRG